jgi:hypothetical protein
MEENHSGIRDKVCYNVVDIGTLLRGQGIGRTDRFMFEWGLGVFGQ